jgi:cell division protein ZapE
MSLKAEYRRRLVSGTLHEDAAQAGALEALARLEAELNEAGESSLLGFFRRPKALRGVYLWGPVGRGKSMLMDLFFGCAPVERKLRVHFHAFMAEVHGLIHSWRTGDTCVRKAKFGRTKGDDPIPPVAELVAGRTRLLCFDEFHVSDIADAMILGRLFEALFAQGVTVVATSNRAPGDLYKDGLNRQLFLPFIALLEERLEVVRLAGPRDYRLDRLKGERAYFSPLSDDCRAEFDRLWRGQLNGDAETGAELEVQGRRLAFPHAAGGLLRTSFAELCDQPLGPADYLAVAGAFHTVFLEEVPCLGPERRNAAKRFVTLIDALYEAGAKLVVLAEVEPDALHPKGDGAFEFERTASRLHEMRSSEYLARARD